MISWFKKKPVEVKHSDLCMCDKCMGLGDLRADLRAVRKAIAYDRQYKTYITDITQNEKKSQVMNNLLKQLRGANEQKG